MSVAFAFNQVYAMRNILELMPVIGGLLTPRRLAKGVAVLLFGVVIFQTAWLAEDAFVTFRTVDNFVHGYGLTWNVAERVQAYSNPLWMLLLIPFYWLSGEIYYTATALSLAVSLAAVVAFIARFVVSGRVALLAACVLVCSKAFTDYSTSGLENPLTHLLLVVFYAVFLDRNRDPNAIWQLALLGALGAVNRLDAAVFFAPPLAYVLWNHWGRRAIRGFCVGLTPLILWELFSLVYYGFLFPNTAYAKLGTGVPLAARLARGVSYLHNSLVIDPWTFSVIVLALVIVWQKRDLGTLSLAAGVVLYLLYTVYIGGDFMSGRFLAAPFWGAVILLFHCGDFRRPATSLALFSATMLVAALVPYTPLLSGVDYAPEQADLHRDERGKFYQNTGLLRSLLREEDGPFPDHWWAERARQVRGGNLQPQIIPGLVEGMLIQPAMYDSTIVAVWMNIGFSGYYAGPGVHIVDAIGLSDPFLARLPSREDPYTGAGHDGRIVPAGYLETIITGTDQFVDARLGKYYDALCVATRGDLFSVRRVVEIWKLNTGAYEELLEWSFFRYPSELEKALSDVRMEPRNPEHRLRVAWEYFKSGEQQSALVALNDAIEINPASFLNFVLVGKMLDGQGHSKKAEIAYRQALYNSPPYLQRLAAAGDDVGILHAYSEMADIYIRLHEEEKAAGVYRDILQRDFAAAGVQLYARMGEFFAALGMEAESVESRRRANK